MIFSVNHCSSKVSVICVLTYTLTSLYDLSEMKPESVLGHRMGDEMDTHRAQLLSALKQMRSKAGDISKKLENISSKIGDENWDTSHGLSFLEVKYHLLLSYCTHVVYYILLKLKGKVTKRHPIFKKLVEIRTTIEKMAPLENKLKYQVSMRAKPIMTFVCL